MPRRTLLSLFFLAGLGLLGCADSRPATSTVTGSATLDGAPLTSGTVYLIALDEKTARNTDLQADGAFKLIEVPPGKYKVLVKEAVDAPVQYDAKGKGVAAARRKGPAVPAKYQDVKTTPFEFDITPDAKLTLPLQSK